MVRIYGVTQTNSGGSGSGSGNAPGLQLTAMTQSNSSSFFTTDGFGIENNANILIIPANKSALFTIQIVANTEATPHKSASWQISGLAKRNTEQSSIMIVGLFPVSSTSDSEMATSKVELSENYAYGGISIRCYGVFNYTVINWAATVTLTEV
jgi:hypothetical protein